MLRATCSSEACIRAEVKKRQTAHSKDEVYQLESVGATEACSGWEGLQALAPAPHPKRRTLPLAHDWLRRQAHSAIAVSRQARHNKDGHAEDAGGPRDKGHRAPKHLEPRAQGCLQRGSHGASLGRCSRSSVQQGGGAAAAAPPAALPIPHRPISCDRAAEVNPAGTELYAKAGEASCSQRRTSVATFIVRPCKREC